MRTTIVPLIVGLIVSASPAAATAQAPSPVADALRSALASAQRNFVGAAEAMPADKYGYHPTEAQMTFGALVLHVASSNEFLCSHISGEAAPTEAKLTAVSPNRGTCPFPSSSLASPVHEGGAAGPLAVVAQFKSAPRVATCGG